MRSTSSIITWFPGRNATYAKGIHALFEGLISMNILVLLCAALLISGCSAIWQAGVYDSDTNGWTFEAPKAGLDFEGRYTYRCGDEEISVWSTVAKVRLVAMGPPIIPMFPFLFWMDLASTGQVSPDGKPIIDNRLTVRMAIKSANTTQDLAKPDVSVVLPATGQHLAFENRTDEISESTGKITKRTIRLIYPVEMKTTDRYSVEFRNILKSCGVPSLEFSKRIQTRYRPLGG